MTDERTRLEELLPFAVNGTLDEAEQAEIEAALAADDTLAAELAFLRVVRREVRAREVAASPGEFGLARLKRAVAAERDTVTPLRRTGWWKAAAVAAVALFTVQTVAILTAPDDVVRLAGGGSGAVEAGPALTVAFRPDATEAEIRALLLSAGVGIVEGPSALGLYRVAPLEGTTLDAAEAALAAAATVVEGGTRD